MKKAKKDALGVSLLGMDERSCKLLTMFFKGPCEGFAQVIDDDHARVDIIDTHFTNTEQLIAKSLERTPKRAIIVLTSSTANRLDNDNLIYLNKPIKAEEMLDAIDWANDISRGKIRSKPFFTIPSATIQKSEPKKPIKPPVASALPPSSSISTPITSKLQQPRVEKSEPKQKKLINLEEQKKKAKYIAGITIDESDFNTAIGVINDINLNDVNMRHLAAYDAKAYYQGYVQSAYKLAVTNSQTLQLTSPHLKPLLILPHSHETWVDADDALLKKIAEILIVANTMNIAAISKELLVTASNIEKIQEMNAFLWKLALWTSKGRYPKAIDTDTPLYLKQWPDFTRYVVTPHALRITGFLINRGPASMVNIADILNIELRYVYVFISAVHALGLAAPSKRQVDHLVKASIPKTPPEKKGLLNRIISKLRG